MGPSGGKGRGIRNGRGQLGRSPERAAARWSHPGEAVRLFLAGATVRTGWKVAAVVGTVLSAVNQGAVITGGDATR